ncbi:MAG TPA: DUF5946 family protein [Candidatus Angelobacter sp.]|nr:DUF5946 family protein [Candidatus Angelobacter sp.]
MAERCPECGAPVGGADGCQKLFDEVLARELSDPLYFSANRTTMDCYALQHPHRYCASFKSFAAHLAGLCCAMEYRRDPAMMRRHPLGPGWASGTRAAAFCGASGRGYR